MVISILHANEGKAHSESLPAQGFGSNEQQFFFTHTKKIKKCMSLTFNEPGMFRLLSITYKYTWKFAYFFDDLYVYLPVCIYACKQLISESAYC